MGSLCIILTAEHESTCISKVELKEYIYYIESYQIVAFICQKMV